MSDGGSSGHSAGETAQLDVLGALRRTHYCGALRADLVDREVVVMSWVHVARDDGGVIFVDLPTARAWCNACFHWGAFFSPSPRGTDREDLKLP